MLGSGSHGKVFVVKYQDRHLAAKQLKIDGDYFKNLYREAANLALLEHDNIVAFCGIGTFEGCTDSLMILTELLATSLFKYLMNAEAISTANKVSIVFDVLSGLEYMHQNPVIVHGDIKSKNILLSESGVAKIADIGNSRLASDSNIPPGGTPPYTAPEADSQYTEKIDVFSFGHLCLVLLTRWEIGSHELCEVQPRDKGKEVLRRKKLFQVLQEKRFLVLLKLKPSIESCLRDEPNE